MENQDSDARMNRENDVVKVISQLKTEIIERKWAEKKARDALDYAESIIDSVKHPLVVLDENRKVISANLAFYDLFNLTPGVVLGQPFGSMADGIFGFDQMKELLSQRTGPEPRVVEIDRSFQFIGRKHLKAAVQGLQYNVKHLRFAFLTIEDVTEQKIAEERLRKALQDKGVLIREVHHRVKNNLQILTSLLALQSSTLDDADQRRVLEDARSRVMAMAAVHESLSANGAVERVPIAPPIRRLVEGLDSIYEDGVKVNLAVCDAAIGIDQATLLCLVLNEIVTNAHKHAFEGVDRDEKLVSIETSVEDGNLKVLVSDNGKGLGRGIDRGATAEWNESLGFTLVRNLVVNQLGGDWKVRDFGGLIHELRFPIQTGYGLPPDVREEGIA